MADQFEALRNLFPQQPKVAGPVRRSPVGAKDYSGAFDALVASGKLNKKKDDGNIVTDVLGGIGGGIMGLLDLADTGRSAVVSGWKEAADAGLGKYGALGLGGLLMGEPPKDSQASWDEFVQQTKDNIGFGDVIQEYRPNASHALKVAGGFVGDVLLDPLTYLTAGSSTVLKGAAKGAARSAGQQLADDALREAVRAGSSKGITKALIKSAEEAGLARKAATEGGGFVDEAFNRLLVDAQKRGAGAFTRGGLARSGVTADLAEQLGIGSLGKAVFGKQIAGTRAFTELSEGTKGLLKAKIRTTAPAQFVRSKFLAPEVKGLYRVAFNEAKPLGDRAASVLAASLKDEPSRLARTWAGQTMRRVGQNFRGLVRDAEGGIDKVASEAAAKAGKPAWSRLAADEAVQATHAFEAGGVDELSNVARNELDRIFNEAQAFGVDVQYRKNFLPHMPTEDARREAFKNAEVRKWVESLRDEQGFQKFRTLVAGMPFLNETKVAGGKNLVDGSVKEINDRFMEKFGIKLFEDNLQEIMPKYIRSVERAIQRARQIELLGQYGLTGRRLDVVTRELNPDRSWEKEVAALRQRRDALVGEQQVQLRNGFTVRRSGLRQAKELYVAQAKDLRARLRNVESELRKAEAAVAKADAKVAAVEQRVAVAKSQVDGLRKQLKQLKQEQSKPVRQQLKKAQQELRDALAEADKIKVTVKQELSKLDVAPRELGERLRPLQQRRQALQAERDALTSQIADLETTLTDINSKMSETLGLTGRKLETALDNARSRAKLLLDAKATAVDEATLAANATVIAQADAADVAQFVQRELDALKPQIEVLTDLPRLSAKQNMTLRMQNEMRERFNTLLGVLTAAKDWDSLGATWRNHIAQQNAIAEFDALADDAMVTVYHGTDAATAASLQNINTIPDGTAARSAAAQNRMPSKMQGLYVAPTRQDALQYGDTVVSFNVKKSDLLPSPEAGPDASVGRAFFNSSAGAVLADGTSVSMSLSPEMRAIANLEAAAAQSDLVAADLGDSIGTLNDMIKIAKDKKWVEKTVLRTRSGMTQLSDQLEMPNWMFEAMTVDHVLGDVNRMWKPLQKYVDLFKAYATMRPGFHVRNAYTALFNMYLEGGIENFANIKKWHDFYGLVEKYPDNYLVKAEQKFGAETAAKLDQALQVVYGSGAGQYGVVGGTSMLKKGSLNPLSEDFRLIQRSRKMGSWVEDHVRGAHAFAVLERGGSTDLAQNIVERWHFNYSDLGSWDQKAKQIIPFWTFFSRNLALQAQTYVRNIPRYNRAIKNFERNMSDDENDPELLPAYYTKAGAIRISGGKTPRYWFPDLPMTLFPNQVSQLTSLSRLPEFISQTSPLIKIPFEAAAGKNFYTGAPTKDKYVPVPTGLSQLVSLVGGDLPSDVFARSESGQPMMKAGWAQALTGALPMLGQIERLAPVTEGSLPSFETAFTFFTGLGSKRLTPEQVRNEQYRLMLEQARKMREQQSLGV